METLHLCFVILEFCGIWRPVSWQSRWNSLAYDSYTFLMILLIYTFTISEFVDLFSSFDNVEEFAKGSFMLLTMIGVCGKVASLLNKRGAIIALTDVLRNELCKPRDSAEAYIQEECDRSSRFNTMWYALLTGSAVMSITVRSLIVDIPLRSLPFKAWLPFSYESSIFAFWFYYLHQLIAHAIAACVNVGFDTLVPGLMMQTCAQIKILKTRFDKMPKLLEAKRNLSWNVNIENSQSKSQYFESKLLTQCIRHHLEIYKFAENSNDIFGYIVFLQYSVSSVVLCVSVYELSKMTMFSAEFMAIILYLACMLVQMFNFCFYAGEMTLQSLEICDAVYEMDWSTFSLKTKKSLITIMVRSLRPITFTCGNIITLSLDSFNTLIKLSYSAFNVLQQSSE